MAYDRDLADRVRALLSSAPDVTERRMFGGLAFLVGGHLAVSVAGQGDLLLRVARSQRDRLLQDARARPFEMQGRMMAGWLQVLAADDLSEDELGRWVGLGVTEARAQPPR